MHLVAVVMGCATSKERLAACKSLPDYGFANYALITPKAEKLSVPVTMGKEESVGAVLSKAEPILVDKGQKNAVSMEIAMEPEVKAPVSKGQRLGTLTVRSGQQVLEEIPLVAEKTVEKLSWWNVFIRVLKRFTMAKV